MVTQDPPDLSTVLSRSVQTQPRRISPPGQGGSASIMFGDDGGQSLIFQMARIADEIPPWGVNWRFRDRHLRAALHMETLLGSTVASLVARYSSLRWELTGPEQTVEVSREILVRGSDFGNGWNTLMRKVSTDLLSTDNGAFIEAIRAGTADTDPVIGLAHLDSNRCIRTGQPQEPVIFLDEDDREHVMKEHQVKILADNPSPIKVMRGMQICGVSRVIRLAQYIRDLTNFRREKIGGRSPNAIHLVAGLSAADLEAVKKRVAADQDQMARMTFSDPLIFSAFDTENGVSTATVELAGVPDGFDLETEMTWYVTALALGFGVDYQDIAPLQQGNLGNSGQSVMLDRKSRGKGPALWQSLIRHLMNFEGILPEGVNFDFDEEDVESDQEEATLAATWIDTLAKAKGAGLTNAEQAQQILLDKGIIDEDQADLFEEEPEPAPVLPGNVQPIRRPGGAPAENRTQPADLGRGERALGAKIETNQDAAVLPGAEPEEREEDAADFGNVMLRQLSDRADEVLARIDADLNS